MALDSNPTAVNSFNGVSDELRAAEVAQSLWDAGAWNSDGKPDPSQGQKGPPPADPPADGAPHPEAPAAVAAGDPSPAADDAHEYSDLDDYLAKAGLDREAFLSLPTKLKVDGKDEDTTLAELIRAGQLDRHTKQESQRFAEQRRAWDTERRAAQAALQQQTQHATQLSQLARQQLYADYQNIDWSQYTAEQQLQIERNFRSRDAQIQQHLANIQASQSQSYARELDAERGRMLEAIPEWREPTKLKADQALISTYAQGKGFTQAELSQVADHRYMQVLRDAARARDLQAEVDTLKAQLAGKTEAALKIVRQAPKAPAPGARLTRDPKVAQLQQARERFGKNRLDTDAQADYAQRLLDAGA